MPLQARPDGSDLQPSPTATTTRLSPYTYYPTGRVHTATATLVPRLGDDAINLTTTYQYDAAGNVVDAVTAGVRGAESLTTHASARYDVRGSNRLGDRRRRSNNGLRL